MKKVLLCMPSGTGQIPSAMVKYLFTMKIPKDVVISLVIIDRMPIMIARNNYLRTAIEQDFDYIRFLDDDNIPETDDALEILLSYDKKIISGAVASRTPFTLNGEQHHALCFFKKGQDKDGAQFYNQYLNMPSEEIFEVDNIGCGCVLIHKDIFTPLFKKYHGFPFEMRMLRYYVIDDKHIPEDEVEKKDIKDGTLRYKSYISEDLLFFERAKRITREKIFLASKVKCTHIGRNEIITVDKHITGNNYSQGLLLRKNFGND